MIKLKELKDLSVDQLERMVVDIHKEIFDLRNKAVSEKKTEKSHLFREKRRTKARVLTLLSERKNPLKNEAVHGE